MVVPLSEAIAEPDAVEVITTLLKVPEDMCKNWLDPARIGSELFDRTVAGAVDLITAPLPSYEPRKEPAGLFGSLFTALGFLETGD